MGETLRSELFDGLDKLPLSEAIGAMGVRFRREVREAFEAMNQLGNAAGHMERAHSMCFPEQVSEGLLEGEEMAVHHLAGAAIHGLLLARGIGPKSIENNGLVQVFDVGEAELVVSALKSKDEHPSYWLRGRSG